MPTRLESVVAIGRSWNTPSMLAVQRLLLPSFTFLCLGFCWRGRAVQQQGYFTVYQLAHYANVGRTNVKSHMSRKANTLDVKVNGWINTAVKLRKYRSSRGLTSSEIELLDFSGNDLFCGV